MKFFNEIDVNSPINGIFAEILDQKPFILENSFFNIETSKIELIVQIYDNPIKTLGFKKTNILWVFVPVFHLFKTYFLVKQFRQMKSTTRKIVLK